MLCIVVMSAMSMQACMFAEFVASITDVKPEADFVCAKCFLVHVANSVCRCARLGIVFVVSVQVEAAFSSACRGLTMAEQPLVCVCVCLCVCVSVFACVCVCLCPCLLNKAV